MFITFIWNLGSMVSLLLQSVCLMERLMKMILVARMNISLSRKTEHELSIFVFKIDLNQESVSLIHFLLLD